MRSRGPWTHQERVRDWINERNAAKRLSRKPVVQAARAVDFVAGYRQRLDAGRALGGSTLRKRSS